METNIKNFWTTADGEKVELEKMSHQHLSNIYWYHLILFDYTHLYALQQLLRNFDGEILPWIPVFLEEVEWIKKKEHGVEIEVDGKKIILIYNTKLTDSVSETKIIGQVNLNELRPMKK